MFALRKNSDAAESPFFKYGCLRGDYCVRSDDAIAFIPKFRKITHNFVAIIQDIFRPFHRPRLIFDTTSCFYIDCRRMRMRWRLSEPCMQIKRPRNLAYLKSIGKLQVQLRLAISMQCLRLFRILRLLRQAGLQTLIGTKFPA